MDHSKRVTTDFFLPEFVPEYYRSIHADLAQMDDEALWQHYVQYGKYEGRASSPHQWREALRSVSEGLGACLEIGPSSSPFLRGSNVYYFDVLDAPRLLEKGRASGLPTENMPEEIHYWHEHGDLSVVDRQFDLVFSSHCIEHQPDLIAHLKQVERILSDDGVYLMWVPDKRFCFDHFLPTTTVQDIVSVHETKRTNMLSKFIDHILFTAHNDPVRHWSGDHGEHNVVRSEMPSVRQAITSGIASYQEGSYLDTHHWHFWPDHFRYVMEQLNLLGHTQFYPVRVYQTLFNFFEFAAVLTKKGKGGDHALTPPCEDSAWAEIKARARDRLLAEEAASSNILQRFIKRFLDL